MINLQLYPYSSEILSRKHPYYSVQTAEIIRSTGNEPIATHEKAVHNW